MSVTLSVSICARSHVSDTSDTDQRTSRLGRLLASSFLGMFLGSLMAGVLQDVSDLLTTLSVVSLCHAVCVLTVLVGVAETVPDDAGDDVDFALAKTGAAEVSAWDGDGEGGGRKKRHPLFSWAGLKESVMTVVRTREGNKRCVIIVTLVGLTLNQCLKVSVARSRG